MTGNPKVFVTQYVSRLDYSELNSYGEVIFLSREEYQPEPTLPEINSTITDKIVSVLKSNYIPGVDFIATTGSAIPNMIVGIVLAKCPSTHRHNILKWSNRKLSYELFKVKV